MELISVTRTSNRTVRRTATRAKSIQAESDSRGHKKSHVAQLNDRTLKTAARHGMKWSDDDVEVLVAMIEADDTTFDMAIRLERSYYSAQVARSHVGFIMRHQAAFDRALKAARKAKKGAR